MTEPIRNERHAFYMQGFADAQAVAKAELKQLREWIKQLKWKSVDKDNMEFEVRTTCYVKDLMTKFANEQLVPDDKNHPLVDEDWEHLKP